MRLPMLAAATLLAAVLLAAAGARAGYDAAWYSTEFWSGEWPDGFAVVKPDVVVAARAAMDKEAPADVSCALPYKAVFHPWNEERSRLSEAHYVTASRIVPLTASRDFEFQPDEETGPIPIAKGQVIDYLIYGAEGYFTVRIDGEEYTASQELFDNVAPVPDDAFLQEEWLQLRCANGPTAWIFVDDLRRTDADGQVGYADGLQAASSDGRGVVEYGVARDLTDAEVAAGAQPK